MVALFFFIICALGALICFIFSIVISYKFNKGSNVEMQGEENVSNLFINYFKKVVPLIIGFTVGFTGMLFFIYPWANITPKAIEGVQAIVGGMLFSSSLAIAINSFMIHYYHQKTPQNLDKFLFRIMICGFVMTAIFLFVTLNGYADYLTYPLINGFSVKKGFVNPSEPSTIAFYAICILAGAILVYFLCDHKLYLEYGEHGLLESTFLVAFPAGIVGARIFYVVGNFNVPIGEGGFGGVFDIGAFVNIRSGGLTILGGAIVGIVAGVSWFMWRKKGHNIWLVVDLVVPTILIAQAIGRWGNFLNCEVHGLASDGSYWNWLPKIVFNNMKWSTSSGSPAQLTDGSIYVPLFFIEGLMNLLGYWTLSHLFGKALRKYTELGDLAFGYVAWYGLTRTLLEPLRDPSYNMGEDGYWSWVWSMVFVLAGCLLILANHLIRYLIKKHKNEPTFRADSKQKSLVAFLALGVATIALLVVGVLMMINGTFTGKIAYNSFNGGLIILILGISALAIAIIPLISFISASKNNGNLVNE